MIDSVILDQLNNVEKEVDSQVIKTKRGRKKKTYSKTWPKINEENTNDITEKRDRLITCVLSDNSKQYLGKEYTEQQINEMDSNYINILSNRYESVLSAQMTKSLGKSVINLYSNIDCSALSVGNQQDLSNDLECDPFLNTAVQRFTCDLYYRSGALLAPISVGIIAGKHYTKNYSPKLNGRSDNGNCESAETGNNNKTEEQGKRLVECNRCKKQELKNLNEQITKQDDMIERKPVELSNNYLYISGVSVVGLAIIGYLLHNKLKKTKTKFNRGSTSI